MAEVSFFDSGNRFGVKISGIESLATVDELAAKMVSAARMALNKAADRARTMAATRIMEEINFPTGYLAPSTDRLTVTQRASGLDLTARVRGRDTPTSLARFVAGSRPQPYAKGLTVQIKRNGKATFLPNSFLQPLNNGNIGLAVRSKTRPAAAYMPKPMKGGRWLLYGPSVDQAFSNIRVDIAPAAAEFLETEFNRLMDLNLP